MIPWVTGGGSENEIYCEWLYYCSDKEILYPRASNDSDVTIGYRSVRGYVSFCDAASEVRELKSRYGTDFARRIPTQYSFRDTWSIGSVPFELMDRARSGAPWWEILLLTAVKYASRRVPCVLPEGVSLPSSVFLAAAAQEKEIAPIPLSRFSQKEREKLGANYLLQIPGYDSQKELNAREFVEYRVQTYGHIMKRFWSDPTASG